MSGPAGESVRCPHYTRLALAGLRRGCWSYVDCPASTCDAAGSDRIRMRMVAAGRTTRLVQMARSVPGVTTVGGWITQAEGA
jgi:hypothetical protein